MNCFEKQCVDVGYLLNCTKQVWVLTDVYSLYFAKMSYSYLVKRKNLSHFP